MTAGVVRAYIQNNLGEQNPLVKVFYMSPMFRQERPQAGRLRQFHQFGAEAIGGAAAEVDAEIISLAHHVYTRAGIKNILLKVNSVGCANCRPQYKILLLEFLKSVEGQLSEPSKQRMEQNPMRVLDSKDENDKAATANAPLIKDHLCAECAAHFAELQSLLSAFRVPFEIDGRIVRGLDYYTKTAFEVVSGDLGSQDALAGGGRYDLLVKELGGKDTPAVGFAAGFERLLMVLEKQNILPREPAGPALFIVAADQRGREWALEQSLTLRRSGVACETDLLRRSVKSQMREADRVKAKWCVVVGEREIAEGVVQLKEMKTGEQSACALSELGHRLANA
jgi:histidyl-tRNA synthetase